MTVPSLWDRILQHNAPSYSVIDEHEQRSQLRNEGYARQGAVNKVEDRIASDTETSIIDDRKGTSQISRAPWLTTACVACLPILVLKTPSTPVSLSGRLLCFRRHVPLTYVQYCAIRVVAKPCHLHRIQICRESICLEGAPPNSPMLDDTHISQY